MSDMATPPSASAPSAASDASPTASASGRLPNFVMVIPRIHTSSCHHATSRGSNPKPTASVPSLSV